MQNDILGHDAGLEIAFESEMHCFRYFDEQFACAHHKTGVGIADSRGELVECARHAGMGVGAKKNFSRTRMAFLR